MTLVQSPAYWLVPLSRCKQLDILRVTWGESRSDRQGEFGWESDPSLVLKNFTTELQFYSEEIQILFIIKNSLLIFLQRFLKDIELPIIFTIEDLGQNCPKIARLQLKFDDDVEHKNIKYQLIDIALIVCIGRTAD